MRNTSKKRIIVLEDDLCRCKVKSIKKTLATFTSESDAPVLLVFDTNGGEAQPCLELYDVVRIIVKESPVVVDGLVLGKCKSVGLVVLQACHNRYAAPHSRFFMHYCQAMFGYSSYFEDGELISRFRKHLIRTREIDEFVRLAIISRTGMSDSTYRELLAEGSFFGKEFSAQRALELRLINKITEGLPDRFGI